jgi:hypothetical protein
MSPKKQDGLGGWTIKDEAKFVNGLGTHIGGTASKGTVVFILKQYRKAVQALRHPATMSFTKAEVLALVDARIEQLTLGTSK